MTLIGEALVPMKPEVPDQELFVVPEEHLDTVKNYIERFDMQFSPEASGLSPLQKEMHPVRIGRHTCEVVKYRDNDGMLVRSLEIPKKLRPAGNERRTATALSITEDEQGAYRADIEVFSFWEMASGDRLILPGKKETLNPGDYRFLQVCVPLIGIRLH